MAERPRSSVLSAPGASYVRHGPPRQRRFARHRPRLRAAENGWAVGVNYREDAKAADAIVETIAKGGGRAVALKGDVSVEADAVAMFDAATNALGPPAAVIANAGIVALTAKLADMSAGRMRRILGVNVLGALLTAREAARRMSKSSGGAGGSIVLISSAAARLGSPNLYVDYAASKGAIDTLTLGLAKERAKILGATAPLAARARPRRSPQRRFV